MYNFNELKGKQIRQEAANQYIFNRLMIVLAVRESVMRIFCLCPHGSGKSAHWDADFHVALPSAWIWHETAAGNAGKGCDAARIDNNEDVVSRCG